MCLWNRRNYFSCDLYGEMPLADETLIDRQIGLCRVPLWGSHSTCQSQRFKWWWTCQTSSLLYFRNFPSFRPSPFNLFKHFLLKHSSSFSYSVGYRLYGVELLQNNVMLHFVIHTDGQELILFVCGVGGWGGGCSTTSRVGMSKIQRGCELKFNVSHIFTKNVIRDY